MFGKRFELFTLFGFKVSLDLSWFLIAVLVAWSLASGYFPNSIPELSTTTYWVMGVVGALGLFAAVVLHELAHSLVARRHGMPMEGITLFLFGGVAEMSEEPPSPKAEALVALAGPLASVGIALLCFLMEVVGQAARWPVSVVGVLSYLAEINLILVLFNMLPAFPLDGGRVLRSVLWRAKRNLRWATRITSQVGSGFGAAMIIIALVMVLAGNFVGGMWLFLIGLFLRHAASMSYRQLLLRRALEGEPVSRFARSDPVTVPRSISVQQLVQDYVYRHHFKLFPVVEGERLVGCVTTRDIKELDPEEWPRQSVSAIVKPCDESNTITPDCDAVEALQRMRKGGVSRMMVVENGELEGVLSLKDLLEFLSLKLELEEGE